MARYVISGFSKDKPGIVKQITQSLYNVKANIEDSSMAVIGGQFAFILIAVIPPGAVAILTRLLDSTAKKERDLRFSINLIPAQPNHRAKKTPAVSRIPHMINVIAKDHPGIVFHVSQTLAAYKVNITDLNTKVVTGKSGKKLYFMAIEAEIPLNANLNRIEKTLRSVAKKQHLDISFHPVNQEIF